MSSQIFSQKTEMRALWSQVKKRDFFEFLGRHFAKMDILKMSKIDLPNFKKTKNTHFLPFNQKHIFINNIIFYNLILDEWLES